MARVRPGSGMPGLWTPPPARVMGDRLLKAKQAEQRIRDAEAKAKAEIAQQAEEEKADLREEVEGLEERFDRLVSDLPKMMPASGGGKRTIKKVLGRDFDIETGFSGEVVRHTAQTLTSGQQTQARSNIGAEATLPHTASTMLRRNAANNGFEARTLSEVNSDLGRFLTRAAAQAGGATSPLSFLNVAGYSAAGDGGDALYRKVSAALTTHQSYFQDSAGAYYELVETHNSAMANGAVSTRVLGGTTRADNSAAFLRAYRRSRAAGYNMLAIERGYFPVESLSALVVDPLAAGVPSGMSPNITIQGAGIRETIIDWHDGTPPGQRDAVTPVHLFYRPSGSPQLDELVIRDLTIVGNREESDQITTTDVARIFCMLLRDVGRIVLQNVGWLNIRDSALEARNADQVVAINCEIEKVIRAGLNVSNCDNFVAIGNVIKQTDDDAIALHTIPNGRKVHNVVVVGNKIEDAVSGVNMLGVKNALIAGNQIDRPRYRGIQVGFEWAFDDPGTPDLDESTISEGATTNLNIAIHDNVISDVIYRKPIDNLHDIPWAIAVRNIARQAGSLAAAPGRNDTATSTVIPLADSAWGNGTTQPQGGSIGVSIRGNKVICMRPSGGTYSATFGEQMFTKFGWKDATLTEAILRSTHGINIRGPHIGMDISGNTLIGMQYGISTKGYTWTPDGATLINSRIADNTLSHITSTITDAYGMYLLPETGELDWIGTVIEGNLVDGDPECRSYARTRPGTGATYRSDGTWTAAGALPGIYAPDIKAVTYRDNRFRNVSRAINRHADTLCSDNIIYGYPVSAGGFSTSNKGVGHMPLPGDGFKYVVTDADPSSATFGALLNVMVESATAQPSSGRYIQGWFVRDSAFANLGAGVRRLGWQRLTTGTGHVASTDWVEVRVTVV